MTPLILLTAPGPDLIPAIRNYLFTKFNLTSVQIESKLISTLPREGSYITSHLSNYQLISDYYGFGDDVTRVDELTAESVGDLIASNYIEPKVFWTDDYVIAKRWLSKLPDTFAYDTETTGLAIKDVGCITMHSFSIDYVKSIVIIDSPQIRELIFDFLTTTDKQVIIHNAAFDVRPIFRATGKFIKNYEDTQLIAQAYLNAVNQPSFSLKSLAGNLYGDWASAKTTFNLYEDSSAYSNPNLVYKGSTESVTHFNLPLIYYAGIDSSATLFTWSNFSERHPTWESVSVEDLLPIPEPRYHEETPRYFYENVLKPLVTTAIRLLENPMPIDMSIIEEIKQKALAQRDPALRKLRTLPKVQQYMEQVRADLIHNFTQPLLQQKANWPVREYKHTPKDRTILMDHISEEQRDPWNIKHIQDALPTHPHPAILQAILDKDPTLAHRHIVKEAMKSHRSVNQLKLEEKLANPKEYIPEKQWELNPNASGQMKGLYKSLGLTSDVLTPKKEESFSTPVLKEIAKVTSDTEVKEIIEQVLFISDTKNLLSQYIVAYEHSNKDGFCYQSLRIPGTKSYRISGAVGKIDKSVISDEPLSGFGVSMCTQPGSTKSAVVAPEGFLIATSDYAG